MFFRGIAILLLCSLFYTSCKKENPYVVYNDTLFQYKTKADSNLISFSYRLKPIMEQNDYRQINRLSDAVNDTISKYIQSVEKLPAPDNGSKFKAATIGYLKALSATVEAYRGYSVFSGEAVYSHRIDSINHQIRQAGLLLDEKLSILLSEQKRFAEENNIELENNQTEK